MLRRFTAILTSLLTSRVIPFGTMTPAKILSAPTSEKFSAAVIREKGGPFIIEDVGLKSMQDEEIRVRVIATGMCHTDLVARDHIYPIAQPIVLGHEGSGIVEATGKKVTKVSPGDRVVMTFDSCSSCRACGEDAPANCEEFWTYNFSGARPDHSHSIFSSSGHPLNDRFFGQSSFAQFAIANPRNVVKVREDAPLDLLGPLGCGVVTGAGAAINALKVSPGSSFAAFGGGAVGLSAVLGARVNGASTIFAVDINNSRLKLAKELGATHVINSTETDAVEEIRKVTGKGVDSSLDSTGNSKALRSAVESLRPRGTCGIVGVSKPGTDIVVDMNDVMLNCKRIMGISQGNAVPDIFVPKLVDLYLDGSFPFDKLVKFYELKDINQAVKDTISGETLKPIIRLS